VPRKSLCEAFERLGTHRLCAIDGHAPGRQADAAQRLALAALDAQVEGEV
jgi:hypothetical protein